MTPIVRNYVVINEWGCRVQCQEMICYTGATGERKPELWEKKDD